MPPALERADRAFQFVDMPLGTHPLCRKYDPPSLARLQLEEALSAQRSNGLRAMIARIRDVTQAA